MRFLFSIFLSIILIGQSFAKTEPSHLVIDINSKEIISANQPSLQRPIASITKLMTAMVVLESTTSLKEYVPYKGTILKSKNVSRYDLLESLLIRSDNEAAESLANSYPGGRTEFIDTMNQKAKTFQMFETKFTDPSGLSAGNVSTPYDLYLLLTNAYQHTVISNTSSSKFFKVETKKNKKITYITFDNTNSRLLSIFDSIVLSKTGYTNPAGRCLVVIVEDNFKKYAIIILGEKNSIDRFNKAKNLIESLPK